jgi:predicted alpha/beta-fold hydrolase
MGLISYSLNNGTDWNTFNFDDELTINCINENNGTYYAACSSGKIISFNLD